jgi:hypothetical protein
MSEEKDADAATDADICLSILESKRSRDYLHLARDKSIQAILTDPDSYVVSITILCFVVLFFGNRPQKALSDDAFWIVGPDFHLPSLCTFPLLTSRYFSSNTRRKRLVLHSFLPQLLPRRVLLLRKSCTRTKSSSSTGNKRHSRGKSRETQSQ